MDKFVEEFSADLKQLGYSDLEIINVILDFVEDYEIQLQIKRDKIIENIKNNLYNEV